MQSKSNGITRRTVMALAATVLALSWQPAGAQEMKKVRILRSPVSQFEPLFLGQEQGIFKKHNIEIEVGIGGAPDQNIAQMQAGKVDLVMTGGVPLVAAVANGLPLVATLNIQNQEKTPTMGLVVPSDSPIKEVADFKGKSIGLPGIASPQGLAVLLMLEKYGIKKDEVKLVNLPFDGMIDSAKNGNVDAIVPIGLFYALATDSGFREFPEAYQFLQQTPAVIYASTKAWAEANAETLKAFNAALTEAYDYANKNPDEVRRIDREQTKLPPAFIEKRFIPPFTAAFNKTRWNEMNTDLTRFGFMARTPAPEEYIWSGAPTN
jgi:NitT/TauT family transport system substrate-binding protein